MICLYEGASAAHSPVRNAMDLERVRTSDVAGSALMGGNLGGQIFPRGKKDKILEKITSSRKLWGAELTREVDLGGGAPLAYPHLRGW